MLTLSTKRAQNSLCVLGASLLLSIAGCANKPSSDGLDGEISGNTSRYESQKAGGAASDSDAVHIPPVPHDPAVESIAQQAIGEYARALQTRLQGEPQKALVMFQSLAERYPQLSGPKLNVGLIYMEMKQFDDASKALNEALAINELNPYTHNALGLVYREQGQFNESQQHYQRALVLDPKYARAHFNLAVLAELYLQDLPLALSHFRAYQTLQKQPDSNVANWIADLERRSPNTPTQPVAENGAGEHHGEIN